MWRQELCSFLPQDHSNESPVCVGYLGTLMNRKNGKPRALKLALLDDVSPGRDYDPPLVPVHRPDSLAARRIAIVCGHGFEEVELTYVLPFLEERGALVDVVTPDWIYRKSRHGVLAVRFLRPSLWVPVDTDITGAAKNQYDCVIVPGGAWNPIICRGDPATINFIAAKASAGALIAAICHGPQVLIDAGLVQGRDVTGVSDIRGDLRNAGARVHVDRPVIVDGRLITSRDPDDLPEFCRAIEMHLAASRAVADGLFTHGELSGDGANPPTPPRG